MKVAELIGVRQFRLADHDLAEPGPGEVQVRVAAIGICGSDMHSYSEGGVGDAPCAYPMVLGHEPSGVVLKIGPGVTGWRPGDRAALEPALYCYHCEFCRSGYHNVCANLRFMSSTADAGFFRERVNLPARNLVAIPPEMSLQQATLMEPLAVILHSMKFAAVGLGETAAVFGAGPIGLLTIIALKLAGASRVWAVEPVPHRREMARSAGAIPVDTPRQIMTDTRGRGVDVAIDCATKDQTISQCIDVVRSAGRVVVTGIPSEVHVPLNFHEMRRKEVTLFNVRRSNHESEGARDMLREHASRFASLITHERPLEKISDAFALVEKYSDGAGKVLLTPSTH